jgi:hypothetical protein
MLVPINQLWWSDHNRFGFGRADLRNVRAGDSRTRRAELELIFAGDISTFVLPHIIALLLQQRQISSD